MMRYDLIKSPHISFRLIASRFRQYVAKRHVCGIDLNGMVGYRYMALAIYMFVVVNFDALAQASAFRIQRR